MECDFCGRRDTDKIGLHCTVCARTAVYPIRLEIARLLLEKEQLNGTIEQVISEGNSKHARPDSLNDDSNDVRALSRAWDLESRKIHVQALKESAEIRTSALSSCKAEIQNLQAQIEQKRLALVQRKKHLEIIRNQLSTRQLNLIGRLNHIGNRGVRSFDTIHKSSVETRAFLCREVASLLGLSYLKKVDGERIRHHFLIAGHLIPNLRSLHHQRCDELTAMLAAVSRLIIMISFYLGVRLPAEITLPHRNYPLTTISHPSSSYLSAKVPFPGSGSNVSLSSSPSSSKHEARAISKPRPLFIGSAKESISQAASQDPVAFKYFVEAMSLLAWDIGWLTHSQGMTHGIGSWEAACDIGRNLWQLIFLPQQSTEAVSVTRRDNRQRQEGPAEASATSPSSRLPEGRLGDYSHASAHAFLGDASVQAQLRPMKLNKHTMIFDPLRRALENEFKNAEWELLGDTEINDGGELFDTGSNGNTVTVSNRGLVDGTYDQTRSIITTTSQDQRPDEGPSNNVRVKGTSGWTKVKTRETSG